MKQFEATSYKNIKLEDMMKYIEENAPEKKKWFKEVAFQNIAGENVDSYNHINAVLKFCEEFAPHLSPERKPKVKASDKLKDW